jgi:DNA primase
MEKATQQYEANIAQIKDYLLGRGIDGATAKRYRLGYVAEPVVGHEKYRNRLAIPYVTPSGVVDIRFRCVQNHSCKEAGCAKYLTQPGHKQRIYGTTAVMSADDTIAITEGELDAVILNKIGIPAVGIAGSKAWNTGYYPRIFADFTNVIIFGDGDEAGRDFAEAVARDLEDALIVDMPTGFDVTDLYLAQGADELYIRAGLRERTVATAPVTADVLVEELI